MIEGLVKSFDNIMFQQTKMDNKAYIFIGFLGILFNLGYKECNEINLYMWLLMVIAVPLLLSLIPIANIFSIKFLEVFFKNDHKGKLNIFYYLDIYNREKEEFIRTFKEEYQEETISPYDEKLIEQILINSKILRRKVLLHNWSQVLAACLFIYFIIRFF